MKSLKKLNIESKVTIVGIAKRLEEIYFPGDSIPLYLNKKSESLKIIQNLSSNKTPSQEEISEFLTNPEGIKK